MLLIHLKIQIKLLRVTLNQIRRITFIMLRIHLSNNCNRNLYLSRIIRERNLRSVVYKAEETVLDNLLIRKSPNRKVNWMNG